MPESTPNSPRVRDGWTRVPHWLTEDPTLSDSAFRVYVLIAAQIDAHTGTGWITQQTIASRSGASRSSVQRAIRDLRQRGLIEIVQRGGRRGGREVASVYRVTQEKPQGVTHDALEPVENDSQGVTSEALEIPKASNPNPKASPVTLPKASPVTPQQEHWNKNTYEQEPSSSGGSEIYTQVNLDTPDTPRHTSLNSTTHLQERDVREPTQRPTPMTNDWEPDPSLVTPQMKHDMDVYGIRFEEVLLSFRDYYIGAKRQDCYWDGRFRKWLLREIQNERKNQPNPGLRSVKNYDGPDDTGMMAWQRYPRPRLVDPEADAERERIREEARALAQRHAN